MKTRKYTKSNPSFTNVGADISVVVLSLLVILASSFLFVKNLNRTFSRNDKTPVATVQYKYKSVQRKFLDRAVWDRPQQNSPVYNGDIIRTSPEAEATLYFVDRNVVELGSSTMIQVFVNNEESRIDLTSGLVSVETSDSSNMLISSENTTAKISKGSSFRADKSGEGNLQLVVEKGEAAVTGQDGAGTAEVLTQGEIIQTGIPVPIVMVSPGKNVRLLDQSGNGVEVPFQWQSSLPTGEELILETSPLGNFSDEVQKYTVTGLTEYTLAKQNRSFYWRLYSATGSESDISAQSGKVNVVVAPAPVLLEPAVEAEYTYMETPPAIRFLWEGNSLVASYLLEVADNPELKNPQLSRFVNTQSLTLSDFTEGTWYWRVTPRYLIGAENAPEASKISFFHIEKQAAAAETPQVLFPQATTETARGKDMSFAWKNISETKSYRLKVAKDAEMKTVVVDTIVESNSFKLDNAAMVLPNGEYYWTVSGIDSKGAEMAASAPAKFETVNTDYMLRSIFPPNGYVLADTLCPDTRFTWKTNIETEKRFQVSASKDFTALTIDMKTTGNGIEGISLPQGQWYWRIVSEGGQAGTIKTEPKYFTVAPPLEKPNLFDIGNMIVVFPEGKTKFAWSPVKGADYYQVRIIKVGNEDSPLYENLFITDTKIEIALQTVNDGNYRVSIQGFAAASVTSTRRYGLAVDHNFVLKHLKPVELVYPANGAKIDGLEAALNPFSFEWVSVVPPSSSTLVLRKSGVGKPVFEASNPAVKVQAPPLEAGKYTWEIKAAVPEGFDISSRKRFAFTVLPVPPLPPVEFGFPKANTVLDAAFFKSNRTIDFKWSRIPDATHYRFKLSDSSGRSIFTADLRADTAHPTVSFKDIARLSPGTFSAEVRAQRRLSNGKVFQDGTIARVRFQIDIPKGRTVSTDETGVLYGK